MPRPHSRAARALTAALAALALLGAGACKSPPSSREGHKVLRMPVRARIGNLDPVQASTSYKGLIVAALFDTLIEFRYPRRPFELQPSLLTTMPEISDDGLTYRFELRDGIRFQDDPAFPGGEGRAIVTDDVFYTLKRSCDPHWSPSGYWLVQGRVRGLDEYKAAESQRRDDLTAADRRDEFAWDYDRAVEGFRKIDDRRFEIVLTEPFPQFLYILTMSYTSVVPREVVEATDLEFGQRPVGSGPYRLAEFRRGSWLKLEKNPTYREEYMPDDLGPDGIALGLDAYAGRRLPLIDEIIIEIFEQDQPMWLKFRAGDLDVVQTPAEYWPTVFEKDGTLKASARASGLQNANLPLLDLIYWGFNMEDPVWGQPPEAKWIRQAISYAIDLEQRNAAFYNSFNTLYLGPIPPGLDGYEPGYRRRDLERARELMKRAGHPMGEGLPPLRYETSRAANAKEQSEMLSRQLADIGIVVDANFNTFPELSDKLDKKKAPLFGLAWGADYPDAENFLQLLYGPNEAPGSNNCNYKNAEFDRLFARARIMPPTPERTEIYRRLREIAIDDQPMIGSMARTRFYLWHPRLRNYRPEEVYYTAWKYLDVVDPDQAAPPLPVAAR